MEKKQSIFNTNLTILFQVNPIVSKTTVGTNQLAYMEKKFSFDIKSNNNMF